MSLLGGTPQPDPTPQDPQAAPPVDPNAATPAPTTPLVDPAQPPTTPPQPTGILNEDGTFAKGWADNHEDLADHAKTLAKFPDPIKMAGAYANLEKMRGVPSADADEKTINTYRQTNGIPENSKDYALNVPTELPEGIQLDEEALGQYKEAFHAAHVAPEQAQALMDYHIKATADTMAAQESQAMQAMQEEHKALRAEWGHDFESNLDRSVAAMKSLALSAGVDVESIPNEIMNSTVFAKLMSAAGKLVGESSPKINGVPQGIGAGAGSLDEANKLMQNPAYFDSTHPEHAAIKAKVSNIFKQKTGGM
jgi:hypothetical protein